MTSWKFTEHMLEEGTSDSFCLEQVGYHGRRVTILFGETGERYGRGKGLRVLVNGRQVDGRDSLQRVTVTLPLKPCHFI